MEERDLPGAPRSADGTAEANNQDEPATDRNDKERQWAPWLRDLPPALRWLVAIGLLIILNLVMRLTGLRDRMQQWGAVIAGLVLLLGLACLVVGFGPRRWIAKDLRRSRRHPLFPTGRLLSRAPSWVQRAFFIVAGTAITALAVFGFLALE